MRRYSSILRASIANATPVPTMFSPRVDLLVETHPPVPHMRGSACGLGCFEVIISHNISRGTPRFVSSSYRRSYRHRIDHGVPQHCLSDSMQPCSSSIRDNSRQRLRVRAGIVLYIAPLGSAGNHNASPRREGLERRNLASRSLLRACFGPINVEFRGGAICEAYRGRPAGLARSRHFVATAGDHTPRSRAHIAPTHPDHATTHPNHPQPRTTGRSRRLLGHSSSPCK